MAKRKVRTKHVFGWQADTSGCYWDRLKSPHEALDTVKGWNTRNGMFLRVDDLPSLDLVVGQRICTAEALPMWGMLLQDGSPATAYEIDDLLFHVEKSNTMSYDFYQDPQVRSQMATCMWSADALVVSCEPLAQELASLNPKVYVIPNYLPKRFLRAPRKAVADDRVVIGWAGGSSHYQDLWQNASGIDSALNALGDRATLHIFGQNYTGLFNVPSAKHLPWCADKTDYLNRLDLDIGLCPLTDSRFNRSKTAVKALEYAFTGTPTVASNVTPYKEFVVGGVTGFLVNNAAEWHDAIVELANNTELRSRMGADAYELAKEHTTEGHKYERAAIYDEILGYSQDVKAAKRQYIQQMTDSGQQIILAGP